MSLRNCTVLIALLLVNGTTMSAAPYKGRGGQIEAYGTIMSTFFIGQKMSEMCGKFPVLKKEAEKTEKKYVAENKPVFDQVNQRLQELAEENGGMAERRRLNAEIKTTIEAEMPDMEKNIAQQLGGVNEHTCSDLLSYIQRGDWNLKARVARKIDTIMGSPEQSPSHSLLNGILEGCIDGQKRQLSQQGLSYQGNEELVRQYCHCMTPLTLDLVSTADGRAKLMDGDPKIKARVQKNETICLDGLKNGRKFAPKN